jgi:hypothetical protein
MCDKNTEKPFTVDDVESCWKHHLYYLVQILNGEYELNEARVDLKELIGSRFDLRTETEVIPKEQNDPT